MPASARFGLVLFFLHAALGWTFLTAAVKWDPPDMSEFARTESALDPEAGAEVILRDVTMDADEGSYSKYRFLVRVRVYNERGIESVSKISLPYDDRTSDLTNLAVRTIKADGTVLELADADIFDREVAKVGKQRMREKSFAPAGLAPGVVVEYRYSIELSETPFLFPLFFQGELPARVVRFHVNPIAIPGYGIQALFLGMPQMSLAADKRGFMHFEQKNLRAYREVPFSPPEFNAQMAIILFYAEASSIPDEKFWPEQSRRLFKQQEDEVSVNAAVREAVKVAVGDATTPAEKARRIHDYCRTRIQNRVRDTFVNPSPNRAKLRPNKGTADTLKNGNGTSEDINYLFAALCRAAGLKIRIAMTNDRDDFLMRPQVKISYMLKHLVVGVEIDGRWTYFDPGATYLPAGMLSWYHTDTFIMPADKKGVELELLTGSAPEESRRTRSGQLAIDEEGTLTGDVTQTYTGVWEADLKYTLDGQTAAEREEFVRDEWKSQPQAEISGIVVENAADPIKQLVIRYKLKIPGYADVTGERLFLQPAVFRKGQPAPLTDTKRESLIVFRHRYIDRDVLDIKLPAGFAVEAGTAPGSRSYGDLGGYRTNLALKRAPTFQALAYEREVIRATTLIDKQYYPAVLAAFEDIHKRDGHPVTLKRAAAGEPATPAPKEAPAAPAVEKASEPAASTP